MLLSIWNKDLPGILIENAGICCCEAVSNYSVDWEDEFRDLDNHEATNGFTGKFLGLVSIHVLNSEIVCNAKDPPWITKHVKNAIRRKHRIYGKYVNNGKKPGEWGNVKLVRNETTR